MSPKDAPFISTIDKQQYTAKLEVCFGGYSCAGHKTINQDAFAAFTPPLNDLVSKGVVSAIADGLSCASKSAEAAQLAVTEFINEYYATEQTWSTRKSAAKVLTSLNQWLNSQVDSNNAQPQQWLTTFSAIIAKSTTGYIFHVGDSRVSLYRGKQLENITDDHNRKKLGNNSVLTRALGAELRLQVDVHQIALQRGDIHLLSTDGLHDFVSNKDIELQLAMISANPSQKELELCAKQLADLAINNGSNDNVSCLLSYVSNIPNRKTEEIERDLITKRVPPALNIGMKIDGYRVCKVIHASTRSHLYLVESEINHDSENNTHIPKGVNNVTCTDKPKLFVIKVPSQNFADDPIYLQGFIREAWAGERIKHKNIMQVKSASSDNPKSQFLYHICEYIEGQTLSEWMHDNPQPSISEVREIIKQIICALRTLQRLELVHRDLKPDNIMIDKYGQVKIIDYGTVLIASLDENSETLQESVPQGSLNYIAPETLLHMSATNLSDLFSLGVICYEMLTGQLPYKPMQNTIISQTSYQQWHYRSVKQFRPNLPIWIDICLKQCTQPDPKIRYQAFSEFATDLSKPNATAVEEYKKQPILQRNPIRFWQSVSCLLFLALIISLTI